MCGTARRKIPEGSAFRGGLKVEVSIDWHSRWGSGRRTFFIKKWGRKWVYMIHTGTGKGGRVHRTIFLKGHPQLLESAP